MPNCKKCNYSFPPKELRDGYCRDCVDPEIIKEEEKIKQEEHEIKIKELEAKARSVRDKRNSVFITTEMQIDIPIEKRIGIVSAQCVYGLSIIKDMFSFVRDIVGGRVGSLELGLSNAHVTVINELKEKAFLSGGDAIIGVKVEHTYNNYNNGSILSVFATGTVVKFAKNDKL